MCTLFVYWVILLSTDAWDFCRTPRLGRHSVCRQSTTALGSHEICAIWGQRIRESCLSLNSGDNHPYGFLDASAFGRSETVAWSC